MMRDSGSLDSSKVVPSSIRDELLELDQRRVAIINDIEEAMSFLSTTPAGLDGPLIDKDGFPRDDCDLYAVRRARHTVNCGRNDIRDIEKLMHEKLSELHESNRDESLAQMERHDAAQRVGASCSKGNGVDMAAKMAQKTPFLRVTHVESGSPAELGGMAPGHLILQFGQVDAAEMLTHGPGVMSRVTASHEGQMLSVWVLDEQQQARELFVVPQRWSGGGLLGSGFEPMCP